MNLREFEELLARQDEVVHRRQLLGGGALQHDLQRWQRRRELTRVLPGVFVTHTGALSWEQRAWAAVLWAEPAALALTSAVRAAGGRPSLLPGEADHHESRIHLLIGRGRRLQPPSWITTSCCQALDSSVLWVASPPRQREEHAALDLAVAHLRSRSRNAHLNAVAALAEPIQARRTTAPRLRAALDDRAKSTRRAWLAGVLADLGAGATSVLEHGYVHRVERPHGLPPAVRQVRQQTASGVVVRDAMLPGRVIELDGRAFHQGARRRDDDLERDLDAATGGLGTTRLGWAQVFDRPCRTAGKVAALLAADGWAGVPRSCGPGCVAPAAFARAA